MSRVVPALNSMFSIRWKVLPILFIFAIFISSVVEGEPVVDGLSYERLVEEAELGNMDAQYRLANLIYHGIIPGWQRLDFKKYLRLAALQGHPKATYELYHALELERSPFRHDEVSAQEMEIKFNELKILLTKLAGNGEAHAYYILHDIFLREAREKQDELGKNLKRKIAAQYLKKSYELGSRYGAMGYADWLAFGIDGIARDMSRAVEIWEEVLTLQPQDSEEKTKDLTCNAIYTLSRIYEGSYTLFGDNGDKKYKEQISIPNRIRILKKGRLNLCSLAMIQLAEYQLEFSTESLIEIYALLLEALEIDLVENRYPPGNDYTYVLLARVAMQLNEPDVARNHLRSLSASDWKGIVTSPWGVGAKICKTKKVSVSNCGSYIFD